MENEHSATDAEHNAATREYIRAWDEALGDFDSLKNYLDNVDTGCLNVLQSQLKRLIRHAAERREEHARNPGTFSNEVL